MTPQSMLNLGLVGLVLRRLTLFLLSLLFASIRLQMRDVRAGRFGGGEVFEAARRHRLMEGGPRVWVRVWRLFFFPVAQPRYTGPINR